MTLILDLTEEQEARLRAEAERCGAPLEEYALERLVGPSMPKPGSLAELFAEWREEDARMAPEEAAKEEADWEEIKAHMNAERAANGERLLFS